MFMVEYLYKTSLLIIVFYGIYFFVFRSFTFHAMNRYFLLLLTMYALVCPVLQFEIHHSLGTPNIEHLLKESRYLAGNYNTVDASLNHGDTDDSGKMLLSIYWTGVFLFFARFVLQVFRLLKIRYTSNEIQVNKVRVFVNNGIPQPFSFFNWIFIPANNSTDHQLIIQHEKIHVHQLHSIDNTVIEIIRIFFWFHPVIYLIKKSIKAIHEFHTDHQVIQNNNSVGEYLNVLLKTKSTAPRASFVNSFYGKSLKKRVKMMVRNQTPKGMWILYLLVIPVFMLFSFSFSTNQGDQNSIPCIKPIMESGIIRIASGYGMRKHPITGEMKMHYAVDIVSKEGTPVVATADGKVIKKEFKEQGKGYGRLILIQHDQVYSTLYTQLSGFNVKINQQVRQGDIIGYVGSSGISTGPHLHYEVWKNGNKVDPEKYFTKPE